MNLFVLREQGFDNGTILHATVARSNKLHTFDRLF